MATGTRELNWMLPVRVLQAIFAIIILGLTAYIINWELYYWGGSADTVDFNLFNAIWTLVIALPYLSIIPIFSPRYSHIYGITAIEVITMIFWFAGFIALAAQLPSARACNWTACRCAQAATVFGAFEWVLFALTTFFAARLTLDAGNRRGDHVKPQVAAHAGV